MTLYLAFEALDAGKLKLTDRVVMSRHAASQPPSRLGLGVGRSLSVEEAIRVIAVKSVTDVAAALAAKIGGPETAFAAIMTAHASNQTGRTTYRERGWQKRYVSVGADSFEK